MVTASSITNPYHQPLYPTPIPNPTCDIGSDHVVTHCEEVVADVQVVIPLEDEYDLEQGKEGREDGAPNIDAPPGHCEEVILVSEDAWGRKGCRGVCEERYKRRRRRGSRGRIE